TGAGMLRLAATAAISGIGGPLKHRTANYSNAFIVCVSGDDIMRRVMEIRQRQGGPIAILELSGRLTVNDRPGLLKEAVVSAVEGGARHVLLDLSGVRYITTRPLGRTTR